MGYAASSAYEWKLFQLLELFQLGNNFMLLFKQLIFTYIKPQLYPQTHEKENGIVNMLL